MIGVSVNIIYVMERLVFLSKGNRIIAIVNKGKINTHFDPSEAAAAVWAAGEDKSDLVVRAVLPARQVPATWLEISSEYRTVAETSSKQANKQPL